MERIQAAIQKAKEQRLAQAAPGAPFGARGQASAAAPAPIRAGLGAVQPDARTKQPTRVVAAAERDPAPIWAGLEAFEPDPRWMQLNRIVTFADQDPVHNTFDMMRTKILRAMRQNGWTSLGITSPTNGCGKTTTSLNIAFSLAHQQDLRTVLIDLDLRRPAVAKHLGLSKPQSIAGVLQGTREIAENFVRYGDNLAIGTNAQGVRSSAELLMSATTVRRVAEIKAAFRPDVILYDLPPVLMSDDTMAFLPHLDCVLLVAAAEKSRIDEVDKCEEDLAEQANLLGVVLNMCRYSGEDYGYY